MKNKETIYIATSDLFYTFFSLPLTFFIITIIVIITISIINVITNISNGTNKLLLILL